MCLQEEKVLIAQPLPEVFIPLKIKYRWVILIIFSLFSLVQSAVWDTWGPISESATEVIGFTPHDYDLLSNWSPIGMLPTMPIFIWLINWKGPRLPVVIGGLLVAVGTGLRCLPLPVATLKYFIHTGQLFNAIAGCAVMGASPLLSNVWFPPTERITATSCMLLLGNLGNALSYLIGPAIVESPNNCTMNASLTVVYPEIIFENGPGNITPTPLVPIVTACTDNRDRMRHQLNILLYLEFALAAVVFILILLFFRNKPDAAPSASAAAERLKILSGLKTLLKNRTYWFLIVSVSLVTGAYYGWYGIVTVLLTPHGMSETEIGQATFVMTIVGAATGILVGWFADRIKGRMKWILIACICCIFIVFLYFVIMVMGWISVAPFKFSKVGFWISFLLIGSLSNTIQPIGLEMAADVAFPVSEGTSTAVFAWLIMLSMFVFLTVLNSVANQDIANYLFLAFLGLAAPLLVVTTKNENVRLDFDDRNRASISDEESEHSNIN